MKISENSGGCLRDFILARIREEGPVPFARFMAWCLYHPEYGYYVADGVKIGKEGDFYTAPSVHPLFGCLIARQLRQMAEFLDTEDFTVLEMGAGRGFLASDILDWAREQAPAFYRRLKYRLMDVSPRFLEEQRERLARHAREGRVSWGKPGELEDPGAPVEGCFLANELVDAFPVHRVVWKDGTLREIYVGEGEGRFVEVTGDLSVPEMGSYFSADDITLAEGQEAEVNLAALAWIGNLGRKLKRGFVLTIDYGSLAAELYASWRRAGTIRAYCEHRVSENLYERVGAQDMTSHVNFSALIRGGEAAGLSCAGLVPQYRFLIGLGLLREMEETGRRMSELEALKMRLSLKHLIEPSLGMGERFQVLIQYKGIEAPQLDGLRDFRAMSPS